MLALSQRVLIPAPGGAGWCGMRRLALAFGLCVHGPAPRPSVPVWCSISSSRPGGSISLPPAASWDPAPGPSSHPAARAVLPPQETQG